MAKIYYGNGEVELDAVNAVFCEILVRYPIRIEDKSPYDFVLVASEKSNLIIIARIRKGGNGVLKELFHYTGKLDIIRASVINDSGEVKSCTIKKVMDITELIDSTVETMTARVEDMGATGQYGGYVTKMEMVDPILEDLQTTYPYYFDNGAQYEGAFHIHKNTGERMTGAKHTDESEYLYFREFVDGVESGDLIKFTYDNLRNTKERKLRGTRSYYNKRRSKRSR